MATQNINIVINATGGVTVVRSLNNIAAAAQGAVAPINRLQTALRAVMGALAIRQLADWADEWTAAANKVNVFTKSQEETNVVLQKLFDIAQGVRQPMSEMVALYHRLSIGAKDLGTSTNQNLAFTENIGKALAVQGTTAQQARGALTQLSQAMGMGRIRAQEFNSMLENLPLVLVTVAKNMDGMDGSVSKLRQKMLDGKLTARAFLEAFQKGYPELEAMFARTDKTFGQGMTVLTNGLSKYLGELNKSLGISNKFFELTSFIANNLDTIGKIAAIVGVALVGAFAPAIVTAFASALGYVVAALVRISALLLANPFAILAVAVAAVIAFGDSWDAGIDGVTTVKDVLRALVEYMLVAFDNVAAIWNDVWSGLINIVSTFYEAATTKTAESIGDWGASYGQFYDDVGTGFAGVLRGIAKTMDAIAGLILGVAIAIGRIFGGLPKVISAIFAEVYNEIASWMEKATNTVIDGINSVRKVVGTGLIDAVKFEKMNVDKKTFEDYGTTIASSIDDGFAMQGNMLLNSVNGLFDRAQQIAKTRRAAMTPQGGFNLDLTGDPSDPQGKSKKAKKDNSLQKLQDQLRTLLNQIDPASGALLEMSKAQGILENAVKRGLITGEQQQTYLVALKQHYKDIIDPLGKYTREIQEEIDLTKLAARERGIEATLMKTKQDLLMKSKPMTDQQVSDMRTLLQLQRDMNEAAAVRDGLVGGSGAEEARQFALQLAEMKKLRDSGQLTPADTTKKLSGDMPDLFAGTQEALDLRAQQFQDMYTKIDQMRQADLISEQTSAQMKMKVAIMESENRIQNYSNMFGALAGLSQSSNRKIAAIGKAAAMTQATIDGVLAVQKALASAPPPYNYALAAAVGVNAAANVAKIAGVGFATGGDFTVGGSGGVDSQMVAFRASPGEKVSVSTPQQVRHGSATKEGGETAVAQKPPVILNVLDPNLVSTYLATPDGQDAVLNVIQNNPAIVRSALGGR